MQHAGSIPAVVLFGEHNSDKVLQANFVVAHVCIMLQVKLPGNPRSSFWRFHTEGTADEGVCTIEAIHLFMRALAGEQHTWQA